MDIPLDITLRDVAPYEEAARDEVEKRAAKLTHFYSRILHCHVVVEASHKHQSMTQYAVRIELSLPNKRVVVSRDRSMRPEHRDVLVAIRDAFHAAERQLEEASQVQRGDVKTHPEAPHGHVASLFPDKGYGFIRTHDGRDIYFHRNSVLDGAFDSLAKGSPVRFVEEKGEKGPQASTVKVIGEHEIVE